MATNLTRDAVVKSAGKKGNFPVLGNFIPAGSHTQDTSITTATVITVADTAATHVMVQNSSDTVNMRYTVEGTTPTATLGFLLEPGWYFISPIEGTTITVIESGGTGQVDFQGLV